MSQSLIFIFFHLTTFSLLWGLVEKGHTLALILSVASLESFLMTKMYFIVFKALSYPEMNQSSLSIAFETFNGK